MSTDTIIKTNYDRELTVKDYGYAFNLGVKDTDGTYAAKGQVTTHLEPEEATQLASALLGENATVVTDLPEVTRDYGCVTANGYDRGQNADPDELVSHAKALLAIAANITEYKAKKAAELEAATIAAKEAEIKRDKRREELAKTFTGNADAKYRYCFTETKAGIDRLIAAEEAAQVS